jgi:rubrerythrin
MKQTRAEDLDWSAMSIKDILELAIADEEHARDYYRRAADMTGNWHTRRIFLSLSDVEQGHADALRRELDEIELQRDLESGMAD